MSYGYAGNILHINLSKGKVTKTRTSDYAKLFVGGRGINAKLMFDLSKPGVDAFDPENPIIIGAGALTGTGLLGEVKYNIMSRSPEQVPQGLAFAIIGGSLPSEMKHAGYDHIVIKGRAEKPTYIHIENEDIAFKDASGLWGKGTFETNQLLREEVDDPEVKILAIGQAGERLVRFATIEHEYRSGTGLGGIWGAKNLKAIAVRGTKGVKVYDAEAILKINEEMIETQKEAERERIRRARERGEPEPKPSPYHTVGADAVGEDFDRAEMGLTGYLEGYEWSELDKTRGEPWLATRGYHGSGCCPIACAGVVTVPGVGTSVFRCYPFWNLWQTKMTDMDKMFKATMLMSDYGMDNRNLCTTVCYLMKLYEMGIITAKDTDGIPMEWGSGDALIQTVHKVAKRDGFGDALADGPLRLAKKLGPKAEAQFFHNRGQIIAGDEHRNRAAYALGEAVDTRRSPENVCNDLSFGELWERSMRKVGLEKEIKEAYARAKKTYGTEKAIIPWRWEGKPIIVITAEQMLLISDILGACGHFGRWRGGYEQKGTLPSPVHPTYLKCFNAATGLNVDEKYLVTAAERTWNVEKAYGVREGFTRDDDTIAEGWHKWPITSGPHKGMVVDKAELEKAKSKVYELRGWDVKTGWPTKETYERLGLKDVAKSLEKLGRIPKKKEAS